MNVAFLFNSDHEKYHGFYGYPILKLILEKDIIQKSNRNMKVSVGDILTFSTASQSKAPTYEYFYELNRQVYTPYNFNYLIQPKLTDLSQTVTIYCLFFQNMSENTAIFLHNSLKLDPSYLGSMDINLKNPYHVYFFKNSLITSYRLHGKKCSLFFSMSENEDPDLSSKEYFETYGYEVIFEDLGAMQTIFDDYDTLEHYTRVQDTKNIFLNIKTLTDDILDDLIISLEELHPKLFNSFAALARTYERVETEEDIAQCALSGRRILEQCADYLFPASDQLYNGRKVGQTQYKNRLWAYIETVVKENSLDIVCIQEVGSQLDKLISLFNAGLHSELNLVDLNTVLENLILFIIQLVNLSPEAARKPYLAYENNIENFMKNIQKL
ncbi:hypothetical protein [Sulfurospirillum barnesii]|uniref:Uncharacterized protein n=1 Tax=Sulfurospirillum barnesii (strain ATCC 700032 / DSM 10660 / SES-3) TaxID=760154 RepID=I3Y0A0_SULBS|nr:hypothetical protein [Sulfurospirillum barnesii]AFL69624.1 hypothetical protein Sulba_2355 [Sulfurospirillum barnesii SES-3]